jgi:hypothetical protein
MAFDDSFEHEAWHDGKVSRDCFIISTANWVAPSAAPLLLRCGVCVATSDMG